MAVTPFEQVRDSNVAAILAKARLLPRDVGHDLMTVYEQAALWLLSDHHISEVDRRALQRLQTAFELSDAAATAATERAASALYERALREALADGVFEPSERKRLDALVLGLGLSEERAFAAYAPIAKEAVQRTVSDAIVDRRYTADEERRVEELARVLDVKMTLSDETSAVLAHYRTLAAIDAGHLPDVPVPVHLQRGEVCHFVAEAAHNEIRTVTQRINTSGPTASIRIMKGVRWRVGSVSVSRVTRDVMTTLDHGVLYVTSKRLFFDGAKKNTAINLLKVMDFMVYNDGLKIQKDTGRDQYFVGDAKWELAGACLDAALVRSRE